MNTNSHINTSHHSQKLLVGQSILSTHHNYPRFATSSRGDPDALTHYKEIYCEKNKAAV
jgi:hypothetical protein